MHRQPPDVDTPTVPGRLAIGRRNGPGQSSRRNHRNTINQQRASRIGERTSVIRIADRQLIPNERKQKKP